VGLGWRNKKKLGVGGSANRAINYKSQKVFLVDLKMVVVGGGVLKTAKAS